MQRSKVQDRLLVDHGEPTVVVGGPGVAATPSAGQATTKMHTYSYGAATTMVIAVITTPLRRAPRS